jgi:hypothetical protein
MGGGSGCIALPFLTSELDGGERAASRPCHSTYTIPSGQEAGWHKTRSGRCAEIFNCRAIRSIARHYSDRALLTLLVDVGSRNDSKQAA